MKMFYFCLGLFTNGTEIIVEYICYSKTDVTVASKNYITDLSASAEQC